MKNRTVLLTIVFATVALAIIATPNTKSEENAPVLRQPDNSVVLPEHLKKEAEATFTKGYSYFIWPAEPGPFVEAVPFFYIAKEKPESFKTAFTIIVRREGSNIFEKRTMAIGMLDYSSRGKSKAFYVGWYEISGKGKAMIHLRDFTTGKKQISNEFISFLKIQHYYLHF